MKKIIEFQRNNGLKPDGVIGKKTLSKMKEVFSISSDIALAHFVGQLDHETGRFSRDIENLNYSEKRLLQIFRSDFDLNKNKKLDFNEIELAKELAGKPIQIANFVYANQNGNGNEQSGDGWKYRGRGAIMLTGKYNYEQFAKWLKLPSLNPDLVATTYYWQTALFFFQKNKVWELCTDVSDKTITKVTRIINGGTIGLQDRIEKTKMYYEILTK